MDVAENLGRLSFDIDTVAASHSMSQICSNFCMDRTRPEVGRDRQLMEGWLRVTAWMDEVATEIDDLETLGTGDTCRELREVR
jgi:hypothetical protein